MITECVACSRRRHFVHVTQVQGFRTCLPHYDRRRWEISYQLEFEHKIMDLKFTKRKIENTVNHFFFFFFFFAIAKFDVWSGRTSMESRTSFSTFFRFSTGKFRTLEENGHLKVFYLVNQLKNKRRFLFGGIWGGRTLCEGWTSFLWGTDKMWLNFETGGLFKNCTEMHPLASYCMKHTKTKLFYLLFNLF